MNVLVVTTSYPRHPGDAAGCFVKARVDALIAAGHHVRVLAAGDSSAGDAGTAIVRIPAGPPGTPPLFYGAGAPERLEAAPLAGGLAAAHFFAGLTRALAGLLPGVDRVESHWLVPSTLAVLARGHRGQHQAHAHSGDVALLERMPGGASLARLLARAGLTLVFASEDLRARFSRLAAVPAAEAARFVVAPADSELSRAPRSPLPRDERDRMRRQRGLAGPVVLGVGRLVAIKGYDRLVRAVGRLPAADRPVVILLGEGPERGALAGLAQAREVDLRLPGLVAPDVVADWLGLADLFVHPARRLPTGRTEGTPVAVQEALAAGVRVIATATGGLSDAWSDSRSDSRSDLKHSWNRLLTLLPETDLAASPAPLTLAITRALRERTSEVASSAQEIGH